MEEHSHDPTHPRRHRHPTHQTTLVVKVGEINDEEHKAFHAPEHIITDTVAEGLRRVVTNPLCCNNLPFMA